MLKRMTEVLSKRRPKLLILPRIQVDNLPCGLQLPQAELLRCVVLVQQVQVASRRCDVLALSQLLCNVLELYLIIVEGVFDMECITTPTTILFTLKTLYAKQNVPKLLQLGLRLLEEHLFVHVRDRLARLSGEQRIRLVATAFCAGYQNAERLFERYHYIFL